MLPVSPVAVVSDYSLCSFKIWRFTRFVQQSVDGILGQADFIQRQQPGGNLLQDQAEVALFLEGADTQPCCAAERKTEVLPAFCAHMLEYSSEVMLRNSSSLSSERKGGPSTRWRMPWTRMTGGNPTRTCKSEDPSETINCNRSDMEYVIPSLTGRTLTVDEFKIKIGRKQRSQASWVLFQHEHGGQGWQRQRRIKNPRRPILMLFSAWVNVRAV